MVKVLPLHKKLLTKAAKHGLTQKLKKQSRLLSSNPQHPSLNLELLEPKSAGIYSVRLDRKYRVLCVYHHHLDAFELLTITSHYQ